MARDDGSGADARFRVREVDIPSGAGVAERYGAAMRFANALLAERAQVDRNLLSVSGAGWEFFSLAKFPGQVHGALAGVMELAPEDASTLPVFRCSVVDLASDEEVSMGTLIFDTMRDPPAEGTPARNPFAVSFQFVANAPGIFEARLRSETSLEGVAISFPVRLATPRSGDG